MEYIPLWERDSHEEGVKIGVQRGEKRGERKGKLDAARKLIERGVDIDIIADATGFPKEEIEKLTKTTH